MKSVKKPAFTLVEVVFSMLVTALCVLAIGDVLQACKKLTSRPHEIMAQHSDIYYSKLQFEKFLSAYPYCQVDEKASSGHAFYFTLQKKAQPNQQKDPRYRLKVYEDMIRMTNSGGQGHVPLVMGVRAASFAHRGRLLIMKITGRDGQQTDLVCKLPPPPPKPKKEKDRKKGQHEAKKKAKGKRVAVEHAAAVNLPAAR
jgi:competence protein ComGF